MRVLWLADANSIHTRRWVRALGRDGVSVCLLSLTACDPSAFGDARNVEVHTRGFSRSLAHRQGALKLAACIGAAVGARRLIRRFSPDLVHAHYASSYGLIGTLSGARPYVLSVWGSDVLVFPRRSRLHRFLIRHNLRHAELVLTTSAALARETARYTPGRVEVTPFGVDVAKFSPGQPERRLFQPDDIVVGTVKALYPEYGVHDLIDAFGLVSARHSKLPLKLLIVGAGPEERKLKEKADGLGLGSRVLFTGHIDDDALPDYYRALTVYVALSHTEGFGVSIAEAGACGKPVVVSDAGALPELVDDGVTGFVVPVGKVGEAALAIERLVLDDQLRQAMGTAARRRVERLYNWQESVSRMIDIYGTVLRRHSRTSPETR